MTYTRAVYVGKQFYCNNQEFTARGRFRQASGTFGGFVNDFQIGYNNDTTTRNTVYGTVDLAGVNNGTLDIGTLLNVGYGRNGYGYLSMGSGWTYYRKIRLDSV